MSNDIPLREVAKMLIQIVERKRPIKRSKYENYPINYKHSDTAPEVSRAENRNQSPREAVNG